MNHSPPSHYMLQAREAHLAHCLYLVYFYLIGIIEIQLIGIAKLQLPSVATNHIHQLYP